MSNYPPGVSGSEPQITGGGVLPDEVHDALSEGYDAMIDGLESFDVPKTIAGLRVMFEVCRSIVSAWNETME